VSFIPPQTELTRRPEKVKAQLTIRARNQRINAAARSQAYSIDLACTPTLCQSASQLNQKKQNELREEANQQIAQSIGDGRILAPYLYPPGPINDDHLIQVNLCPGKLRHTANIQWSI
jgi:hypothetical protein